MTKGVAVPISVANWLNVNQHQVVAVLHLMLQEIFLVGGSKSETCSTFTNSVSDEDATLGDMVGINMPP